MRQFSYLAMLLAVLACTVPMERVPGARVLRRPRRLLCTLGMVLVPFVTWDVLATEAGHWSFDPDQTLGVRVLGLPLEELAFFVVIPLAVIYTVEAVRAMLARSR
ncbi:MAG: lycopene cyclase domain-containing protein [Sporichthyaceae bacterium]